MMQTSNAYGFLLRLQEFTPYSPYSYKRVNCDDTVAMQLTIKTLSCFLTIEKLNVEENATE